MTAPPWWTVCPPTVSQNKPVLPYAACVGSFVTVMATWLAQTMWEKMSRRRKAYLTCQGLESWSSRNFSRWKNKRVVLDCHWVWLLAFTVAPPSVGRNTAPNSSLEMKGMWQPAWCHLVSLSLPRDWLETTGWPLRSVHWPGENYLMTVQMSTPVKFSGTPGMACHHCGDSQGLGSWGQ